MRGYLSIIKRLIKGFAVLFTAIFFLAAYTPLANVAARPLILPEQLVKSDVIIVLGGGAYENGVLGAPSNERLLRGLLLYKNSLAPAIIFSGGAITSASTKFIHTITASDDRSAINAPEAAVMYDTAVALGIPKNDMSVDGRSTNTRENLKDVKELMIKNAQKTCLIVTSSTHIMRAMLIAEKLGMDCAPAPVIDTTALRRSAMDRITLFHSVLWEYAGLVLYRVYGYI